MVSRTNETYENATYEINVVHGELPSFERSDDRYKTPRHPRWTREETMVLIEGKNLAEERGRKCRKSKSVSGPVQVEPKWDYVSSYCRQNGVSRGPVQCRKRWSNLLSDYKKIKKWESERDNESYWMMRSDVRRQQKLSSFFDREVYDVMDGKEFTRASYQLALVTTSVDENNGDDLDDQEAEGEDEMVDDEELLDESFSEFEQLAQEFGISPEKGKVQTDGQRTTIPSPVPISELKYQSFQQENSDEDTGKKRQADPHFWGGSQFEEGVKKRKQSSSDCKNIEADDSLIKALERNANLLNAQLEDQKLNYQLEREQQKDQHDSLVAALTKITDVLEKIADKL